MNVLRKPPLEHPLTVHGISKALVWCVASWVLLGFHVWALCRDVGAHAPVAGLAVTGFAAAWLVGFFVIIAAAGFGPREAVLVAVLNGSLTGGTESRWWSRGP